MKKPSLKTKLLLAVTPVLVLLCVAEFACRGIVINDDERNTLYQFDEELGWFPIPDLETDYGTGGNYPIHVRHNSLGFRDREFGPKSGHRTAFVGDSFAWGFDSQVEHRFDTLLASALPEREFVNLGVSGYGTDQELLLLKRFLATVDPDLVYLFYHPNDRYTNTRNRVFNGYFKPIATLDAEGGALTIEGIPVPMGMQHLKYEHPLLFKSNFVKWATTRMLHSLSPEKTYPDTTTDLLLEIRKYLADHGVELKIGIVGSYTDPEIESVLEQHGFDHTVLDPTGREEDPHLFTDTGHWTIEGNQRAARLIEQHLGEAPSGQQP